MKFLRTILTAVMLLGAIGANAGPVKVYWSEENDWTRFAQGGTGGQVVRADADGSNATVISTGQFSRIDDVEIDSASNIIYFNNWVSGAPGPTEGIYRTNLDGSGQTQITSGPGQTDSTTGHPSGLHGLAVDPTTGHVYFTRGVSYADFGGSGPEVSRVNSDGTGYVKLNGNSDGWFLSGIDIDPTTGQIYWGSPGIITGGANDGAVNRMESDGTGRLQLVGHTDGLGRSMVLDALNNILFVSAWDIQRPASGGQIWALDLLTGAFNQIFGSDFGIPDMELDVANGRLWFTLFGSGRNASDGSIASINYDGSGLITHISGLNNVFGLALEFAAVPEPGTLGLLGLGLIGMGLARRRKSTA